MTDLIFDAIINPSTLDPNHPYTSRPFMSSVPAPPRAHSMLGHSMSWTLPVAKDVVTMPVNPIGAPNQWHAKKSSLWLKS